MNDSDCERNVDYVRFYPQVDTGWELYAPIESERADDLLEETYGILETVDNTLDSFFSPTGLEYTVHFGQTDDELENLLELDDGEMGRIDDEDEFSFPQLISELRTKMNAIDSVRWLSRVRIDRGSTRIRLADGDRLINTDSNHYKRDSVALQTDHPPTSEPVTVEVFADIRHSPPRFEVIIWTNTDIWFENSEIGAFNRARLGDAIQRLKDALNVTEFGLYSESYSAKWLREQGFDEIAPVK